MILFHRELLFFFLIIVLLMFKLKKCCILYKIFNVGLFALSKFIHSHSFFPKYQIQKDIQEQQQNIYHSLYSSKHLSIAKFSLHFLKYELADLFLWAITAARVKYHSVLWLDCSSAMGIWLVREYTISKRAFIYYWNFFCISFNKIAVIISKIPVASIHILGVNCPIVIENK